MPADAPRPFDLLRRARRAGVIGFVLFGVAVVGLLADRSLLPVWFLLAFVGLGSVLRGTQLGAAAYRAWLADQAGTELEERRDGSGTRGWRARPRRR